MIEFPSNAQIAHKKLPFIEWHFQKCSISDRQYGFSAEKKIAWIFLGFFDCIRYMRIGWL